MTSSPIRVIVADDELMARKRIVRLLTRHAGLHVVAECSTGDATVAATRALQPDLLLLDIQMPGPDGFDVVRQLAPGTLPLVIFVTAYDRYAVRAFEVHALDYLLKPFDEARFDQTIGWVRTHLGSSLAAIRASLGQLVGPLTAVRGASLGTPRSQRFAIKCAGAVMFLPIGSITHIAAEGCYARIHTSGRSYLVRESLASLDGRLPSRLFARVHRSTIVNLDGVVLIEPLAHGEARVTLTCGLVVKASRNYRDAITALRDEPLADRTTNPSS